MNKQEKEQVLHTLKSALNKGQGLSLDNTSEVYKILNRKPGRQPGYHPTKKVAA